MLWLEVRFGKEADLPIISMEVFLSELPRKEGHVLVVLFMSFASCSGLCEL